MMRTGVLLLAMLTPAYALELSVADGVLQETDRTGPKSVHFPDVAWNPDYPQRLEEGMLVRRAYRLPGGALTTLQLMAPLRDSIVAAGYEPIFACDASTCGGFDFRFSVDLIGEPSMHVDLGDYRYFLAHSAQGTPKSIAVVTSRSAEAGFVHISELYNSDAPLPEAEVPEPDKTDMAAPRVGGQLIDQLVSEGRAVLEDLDFASGAATLGEGPYSSLEALAAWLTSTEGAEVVLVGHTDAVGSLDGNTELSRRRAQEVASRLVEDFGVLQDQVSAEGAGFLAPRASNLSATGRALNRRVEAVLLSTPQ